MMERSNYRFLKTVRHWLVGTCLLMSACGLPSAVVVQPPTLLSVNGADVTFSVGESSGFVLYYRVYSPEQDPIRDLSDSGYANEVDIFRYYAHQRSFPSTATSVVQPRFIWQPSANQAPPYQITLDTLSGAIEIYDSSQALLFADTLIRHNLLSFNNFRRGDSDLPSGFSYATGQLSWAAMNTILDGSTMTSLVSRPIYLHHVVVSVN
jgi:hypothetical protein